MVGFGLESLQLLDFSKDSLEVLALAKSSEARKHLLLALAVEGEVVELCLELCIIRQFFFPL